MSRTYSIACTKCKKHLWIAQGQGYNEVFKLHLYNESDKHLTLERFFIDHYRHALVFDDNCESLPDDYEEIEG